MSLLHLQLAVSTLEAGGIVAYPTEGVWGLGCDPLNPDAVTRLLSIKQRDWRKGLILIAAQPAQLWSYVDPSNHNLLEKAASITGSPVTWLLPASKNCPPWLKGRHTAIAVRITRHQQAASLCQAWEGALVSTSANISRRPPAVTALQCRRRLGRHLDYLLPGKVDSPGHVSEIRDALSNRVIRAAGNP